MYAHADGRNKAMARTMNVRIEKPAPRLIEDGDEGGLALLVALALICEDADVP
jgi:hypothetical protein